MPIKRDNATRSRVKKIDNWDAGNELVREWVIGARAEPRPFGEKVSR